MAESKKRDGSSVRMKEKNAFDDLDIGKDFFTSWNADGDVLDFDLIPASKGNKKPFNFDKSDMDFNFDGDFGKISDFNVDMSDLDISPPLKKDGKSKEKSKELASKKDAGSSFNMDMADLDISSPLKKAGKSTKNLKESSSGKNTGPSFNMDMSELDITRPFKKDGNPKEKSNQLSSGKDARKADRFAFAFDFDELDNFGFDSSLAKQNSKAQSDKNIKEKSPDRSGYQDKEASVNINVISGVSTEEDKAKKPSVPETQITFDMDCLVGKSVDLETTKKTCPSISGVDDAITTESSAAIDEVESDMANNLPEIPVVSRELPNNIQSIELGLHGPIDLDACNGNDAMKETSSDYSFKEPNGGNALDTKNKVDSMHTNDTGSNGERDANVILAASSTCNTLSKNSQLLQTVAISENINNENCLDLVEDNVLDDRGTTELCQSDSIVENTHTASAASGILCGPLSGRENQEPATMIPKLSVVSQPTSLLEKQIKNRKEPLINCSLAPIQPEKHENPLLKLSTQATFCSLNSKKMGFAQPTLFEGRRDGNSSQCEKKLVSLSFQHSKTLQKGELPHIRSQENCNGVRICGELGSKTTNDSLAKKIMDMEKTKPAMRQRETRMKDLDTLSMDINKKSATNSESTTTSASVPSNKNNSMEKPQISSGEGGGKTADLSGLKLTGLSLDSRKSSIHQDSKPVGNSQKSVLLRKIPSNVAQLPDTQKKMPSTLSMKRILEDAASNSIVLHPPKRLSLSASTSSKNLVETSGKVLNKKVPCSNHLEDDLVKSTFGNGEVMATHLPLEVKNKGEEMPFSIQNDSNIKMADAYSKELDDLCSILRKKHDEAKDILARAIINSNKLLLLHDPLLERKVRATQNMFARLTLSSVDG